MKMVKSNANANDESSDTAMIGRGVEVSGEIVFTNRLSVHGKVTGKLISSGGLLVIEETGKVEAEIDVGVCVIRGDFEGNLKAKARIEIYKTSKVRSDMATPMLLVEEGAVFNGTIVMGKAASNYSQEGIQPESGEESYKAKGA